MAAEGSWFKQGYAGSDTALKLSCPIKAREKQVAGLTECAVVAGVLSSLGRHEQAALNAVSNSNEMHTNIAASRRSTWGRAARALTLSAAVASAQAALPPADAGPATVLSEGGRIVVSNAVIAAGWVAGDQGLRPLFVRDVANQRQLVFTGEVFEVVLTNGQRYAASALYPTGPRRVSELTPDPKAARLAGRIPGRQVELPLRSADGQLRVVWRALLHDGGNYVRQEIDVSAAGDDCVIQEIRWLAQAIPEAQTVGRVDGSPVVAGSFFLGAEDPHALNEVKAPPQPMGTWSPADVDLGKPRRKSWPVDASLLRPGTNVFAFRYTRGPHRLDLWRASLLEDGREVASDEHHGWTGLEPADNEYALVLPQVNPAAGYELAADIGTDPGLKLPAGRRVESFGQVFLAGRDGPVVCRIPRNAVLRRGELLTQSFVLGVAPAGQMRRAFLRYLERERAHPYRPYLHYNSWYDTAWNPFALNETNCLEAIRLCGERFILPYKVTMDGMVFDDGWDDPKTLWQFHRGFPNGFTPLAELCRQYHTRLGVWLSPFGGYGEPKEQRLKFGRQQGFETNATGFSLAGPKYYAAFKAACVGMIRKYGVNHFKFDGIATGMYASGGAQYVLDTEAMRRLMLELRQEEPNLYINLTTGSWPSPFWLRYADSLWRQGNDMGFAGKGPKQQQWLTYRDQEVYRNVVRKGPLYPLNSLMTQGVAYSRHGLAGDPTFDSAGFKDDVRAFFGSGTSLQELYIQPGKLASEDWRVLAEAAKWSRANADVFVDTHWIGGDPSRLEVYGYASWSPRKGLLMLRNPDDQPHGFALDVGAAFELPEAAPTTYLLQSPWAGDAAKPELRAKAGKALRLVLEPFEIVVLEAVPSP